MYSFLFGLLPSVRVPRSPGAIPFSRSIGRVRPHGKIFSWGIADHDSSCTVLRIKLFGRSIRRGCLSRIFEEFAVLCWIFGAVIFGALPFSYKPHPFTIATRSGSVDWQLWLCGEFRCAPKQSEFSPSIFVHHDAIQSARCLVKEVEQRRLFSWYAQQFRNNNRLGLRNCCDFHNRAILASQLSVVCAVRRLITFCRYTATREHFKLQEFVQVCNALSICHRFFPHWMTVVWCQGGHIPLGLQCVAVYPFSPLINIAIVFLMMATLFLWILYFACLVHGGT